MEYRVGIDLGGTNVAVGVVDENKQIIARASIKTRPERMLDDVIYDIGCCVKEAVKKAGITLQDCVSVGIGSPGYCRADRRPSEVPRQPPTIPKRPARSESSGPGPGR